MPRQNCVCAESRSGGDNGQSVQRHHAIIELDGMGKTGGQFITVGDAEKSRLIFRGDFEQQRADFRSRFRVEVPGWFIRKQQRWLVNQGSADGDALAFPPGKPPGAMMQAMGQAHAIDELNGTTVHIGLGCEARERRQQDIFQDTALRQQLVVLKDETDVLISKSRQPRRGKSPWILAEDFNEPRGRLIKRAGDVKQRAFSATGRSPDGDGSPGGHSQIDISKNGHCSRWPGKRASDILEIQDKRHYYDSCNTRNLPGTLTTASGWRAVAAVVRDLHCGQL